jgi:hypothetical protein
MIGTGLIITLYVKSGIAVKNGPILWLSFVGRRFHIIVSLLEWGKTIFQSKRLYNLQRFEVCVSSPKCVCWIFNCFFPLMKSWTCKWAYFTGLCC